MKARIYILCCFFFVGLNHDVCSQKDHFNMVELEYWHWVEGETYYSFPNVALYSSALHLSYTRYFWPLGKGFSAGMGLGYFITGQGREERAWGVLLGDRNGFSLFSSLAFQGRGRAISPVVNLKAGYLHTHVWDKEVWGAGTYLLQMSGGVRYRLHHSSFIHCSLGVTSSRDTWFIPLTLGVSW